MKAYLSLMAVPAWWMLSISGPAFARPPEEVVPGRPPAEKAVARDAADEKKEKEKEPAADAAAMKEADAALGQAAAEDAKVLDALLKEDWVVEVKQREIVLTSKFEVFRKSYHRAAGDPMPEFSDAVPRSELLADAAAEKYVIRLEYVRELTKEEYERRLAERQGAAITMAVGARSKDESAIAHHLLADTRVPRYKSFKGGGTFHIYECNSDLLSGRLFPPAAVKKIGAAKAILAEELRLMTSATDATAVRK